MLEIKNYSAKSFTVIGETKPIKDVLKNLGGRFNPFLSSGPGWIFGNGRRPQVEQFISEYLGSQTATTLNTGSYLQPENKPAPNVQTIPDAQIVSNILPGAENLTPEPPKQQTAPPVKAKPGSTGPKDKPTKKQAAQTIGQQITKALKFLPEYRRSLRSIHILEYGLCKGGKLYMSDLESFISFDPNIKGILDGLLIPIEPLKKAKTAEIIQDGQRVLIDGVSYPCRQLTEDETFPEVDNGEVRNIGGADSFSFLNPAFLGKDELRRPVMMQFFYNSDKKEFAATDAHKLRVYKAGSGCTLTESILMPAHASNISEFCSVFRYGDDRLLFVFGDFILNIREIDEKYLNYSAVIPDTENSTAQIDINEGMKAFFMSELPKLKSAANKEAKAFVLQYGANESGRLTLTVSAQDLDQGTEYSNTVEFGSTFKGEPGKIGFNVLHFETVLKETKENATLYLFGNSAAALPRPAAIQDSAGSLLLMPVMTKSEA
jgi:hypothetical protein